MRAGHGRETQLLMITSEDVEARKVRLDKLARGLAWETSLIIQCDDDLLFVKRRAYLKAIRDALAGVEEGQVVLAKAKRRHTEQSKARGEAQ
jgi:hypothetical protein